jgi:hypothetical protein
MIEITLPKTFLDMFTDEVKMIEERMLVGERLGMRSALRGLAEAEVEAVSDHSKSGLLERILERGVKVLETEEDLTGIYRPRYSGKQEQYWMEYGTHVPEVDDRLMHMHFGASGDEGFRMHHEAFDVPAHPFFFSTAEAFQDQFVALFTAAVQEALQA